MAMKTRVTVNSEAAPKLEYGYAAHMSMTIVGVHDPKVNSGVFVGSYRGNSFFQALNSFAPGEAIELLLRAVNNRTVERNYFRLYSQLLEGSISEDAFDSEIEKNESEYVIETKNKPKKEDMEVALRLATQIKDVTSSSDLSTLFSFDPDETDKLLALPEIGDGNV